jgi:hypothetical protein
MWSKLLVGVAGIPGGEMANIPRWKSSHYSPNIFKGEVVNICK